MSNQSRSNMDYYSDFAAIAENIFNSMARSNNVVCVREAIVKTYNTSTKRATLVFPEDPNVITTEYENITNKTLTVNQKVYIFHKYGDVEQGWIMA